MSNLADNSGEIVDTLRLKSDLGDVSDKRGKIARMIRSGALIQLRRGLYATRPDINPLCVAASLYGPSYISYETALSFYGLIPEAVHEIISATLKRPRQFENGMGRFRFHAVPEEVYLIGIDRVTDAGLPFLIASPTKAVCDRIAREPGMRSMTDVRRWAEIMRLDVEMDLDPETVAACARGYGRPSVRWLQRTLSKYGGLAS
jgi:hypothetical protein